jgi:hypothetical protein
MRTRWYVVFRHGSNSANQTMQQVRPLGTYEAGSQAEACKQAGDEHTCYANQILTSAPVSRLSAATVREAEENAYYMQQGTA